MRIRESTGLEDCFFNLLKSMDLRGFLLLLIESVAGRSLKGEELRGRARKALSTFLSTVGFAPGSGREVSHENEPPTPWSRMRLRRLHLVAYSNFGRRLCQAEPPLKVAEGTHQDALQSGTGAHGYWPTLRVEC